MTPDILFFACINILMAWGVYIALSAGVLNFGAAAFVAMGCYGAGILTVKFGMPLIPACIVGGIGAGLAGFILGYPALRLRGIYLILTTLGIAMSTQVIFENVEYVGSSVGFGGMSGATLWHAGISVAVVGIALFLLSISPLQRTIDAVREDDDIAAALGINSVFVKLMAFSIGSAICGYAGGLYGHYLTFVRPDTFNVLMSTYAVMFVILGGTNNMLGCALGAAIMTIVPEEVTFMREWRPTVFAVVIIVLLLFRPQGLTVKRFKTIKLSRKESVEQHETLAKLKEEVQ